MRFRSDKAAPAVGQGDDPADRPGMARSDDGAGMDGRDPAGTPRRHGLKNWRVRSRLLLLITVPTLTAMVLGGLRIDSSVRSALVYQRVELLTRLTADVSVLDLGLENERDQTVYYIAMPDGRSAALTPSASTASKAAATQELRTVQADYTATDRSVSTVKSLLGQIGPTYSTFPRQAAAGALRVLAGLAPLRAASTGTQMSASTVLQKYSQIIDALSPSEMTLALQGETGRGSTDATLAQDIGVLGLVSRMKEEASTQRAILAAGLLRGSLTSAELQALTSAQAAQQSDLQSFQLSASPSQVRLWNSSVAKSQVHVAAQEEAQAIALQSSSGTLKRDPTTAAAWYSTMSDVITSQIGAVEDSLDTAVTSRAAYLQSSSVSSAATVGAAVLLVLALALVLMVAVARSMVGPLRRLRTGALEVAGVRLPDTVRQMSEGDGRAVPLEVEPISVDSTDEIGEVARAFDQVHREALRLAANEAALRGNVNAMFVNLSRRTQSLVERQIHLIDDLEQGEQDPDRLASLFQLDHLATRMRRNSENLLVLAGQDMTRRWSQAVTLVDVLRAAVSEIEQYERVTLSVQPGIAVRGQVVNDVVHLVAELVENATAFSAADSPVHVSGHVLGSGGVLLEVTDEGVGIGADEMAHANWRLDNPPVVDVAVSRRMGLFVVARLAARHGIRVRLRPSPQGGLTAMVWLPDEVVLRDATEDPSAGAAGSAAGYVMVGADGEALGMAVARSGDGQGGMPVSRAPRFTPLRAGRGGTGAFPVLGADAGAAGLEPGFAYEPESAALPERGPMPSVAATSPIPVFGAPIADEGASLAGWAGDNGTGSSPMPTMGGSGPMPSMGGTGPMPGDPLAGRGLGTGPMPTMGGSGPMPSMGGTGPMPGDPLAGRGLGTGPIPASPSGPPAFDTGPFGVETERGPRGVVVPPAASLGEGNRLPIFESVESDWFRRGRNTSDGAGEPGKTSDSTWASAAADAGWEAAELAQAPASDGLTPSGLPKRVPRANLVPGSVSASGEFATPVPPRSAERTRDRLASFQRGVRQGRAAARDHAAPGDGDDDAT